MLCSTVLYCTAFCSTTLLMILLRTEDMIPEFVVGPQRGKTDWLQQRAETNLMKLNTNYVFQLCLI